MAMRAVFDTESSNSGAPIVREFIGEAYETVKLVADHMDGVQLVADNIEAVQGVLDNLEGIAAIGGLAPEIQVIGQTADEIIAVAAIAEAVTQVAAIRTSVVAAVNAVPGVLANATAATNAAASAAASAVLAGTIVGNLGGGLTGQFLRKQNDNPYAYSWETIVGGGDMLGFVYDPLGKVADAFSMDNMVEGDNAKIMTAAERAGLHGHANKEVLDATTASFLTAEKSKLAAIAAGATAYTDALVRAVVLTGISLATNAAITAADTVLSALGKLQKQVTDVIALRGAANGVAPLGADSKISTAYLPDAVLGTLKYQETWNATTNTPAIPAAAAGNKGWYYSVATAGATDIGGVTDWKVGDWLVSNGVAWQKIDNTDQVVSVAGLSGAITAAALRTALALVVGTDVQAYDADTVKSDVTAVLSVGYTTNEFNAGTKSSGTFTPVPASGNIQVALNAGAHTLAPPAATATMIIRYANQAGAGVVTTSGFTKVTGDVMTTTLNSEFLLHIVRSGNRSTLHIQALQ